MVFMAECQAAYIVDCLQQMATQRIVSVQVSMLFLFLFPISSSCHDDHHDFSSFAQSNVDLIFVCRIIVDSIQTPVHVWYICISFYFLIFYLFKSSPVVFFQENS